RSLAEKCCASADTAAQIRLTAANTVLMAPLSLGLVQAYATKAAGQCPLGVTGGHGGNSARCPVYTSSGHQAPEHSYADRTASDFPSTRSGGRPSKFIAPNNKS